MKLHRNLVVFAMLPALAAPATGAERTIKVNADYLIIPVSHSRDRVKITMEADGMDLLPVDVRLTDGTPDYSVPRRRRPGEHLKVHSPRQPCRGGEP